MSACLACSKTADSLNGRVKVPGDKSISHRSLMLAAMAKGTSVISGLLEGEDVIATSEALKSLGVPIARMSNASWQVDGVGVGGLKVPHSPLNMGNAGTGVRLMMGLVAGHGLQVTFTGDASLSSRPMQRVMTPLEQMGASFDSQDGRLPATLHPHDGLQAIRYHSPVASAQVKSAVLLAGLGTEGVTQVIEDISTRDHTERMLQGMGANLTVEQENGKSVISIEGRPTLTPLEMTVPGDPSSAAFLVVSALIVPGSSLVVEEVCINPLRTGLFDTLIEMGADLKFVNQREVAGDMVADIEVKYSQLKGVTVPAERASSMIDEYPILAVAASYADGTTTMLGLEELKVKESNRLKAIADGLETNGVDVQMGDDSLTVRGGEVPGGGEVETHLDHRIAMAFLVLGMQAKQPVWIDDCRMINTSFPCFIELMNRIGGVMQ